MWLSRGLLASTLILAVKAQDGIEDAAMRIASGFAESLIQHAVTTLSGDAGGAGDAGDNVNAGDQGNQGNQGNQGQAFDASLIDAATVTHIVDGQPIVETYTKPGGQLFPVTLLPHPRITIAPTSDDPYERIIQAYTGGADATTNQEITIAEPTGTKPGTIIVDVPGSAYSSFSSGQAGALTIPPSNDHPTATVISALPSGVGITGEATRTIPAAGGASATVVIQTPWEDVPPSTPGAGIGGGAGGAGGNVGGSTSNVLVIQTYTGTEVITQARVTTIAGSGGDQGTVVVQVPPGNQNPGGAVTIPPSGDSHFTTIVKEYTGDIPISTPVTRLVPTSGTQDGTIIIETPGTSSPTGGSGSQGGNSPENQPQVIPPNGNSPYSTILRPHAGPDEITEPVTYTIPPTGTNPGTVIIETPAVRVGQSTITLPSDPGSGYITIVRQPTGTGVITAPTTITVPPSNGQPGTIIIETPAPQPGAGEITIPAGADGSFVTIIRGPTGTNAVNVPTTITVTGAPGQPGTVIIETPVGSGGQTTRPPDGPFTISAPGSQYVTVFRPHSGDPITVPVTLTQPGQNGQPGTIIIETPSPTSPAPGSGPITIPAGGGSPYVTVYRPHSGSAITQPITITVSPSGGQPGTIIVETPFETPKGQNAVTSNESGGQQITIPPSKNNPYVTIYRPHTGDPITVPITITQSPSNGQPGTIIIETPAPPPQTVTQVETAPGATVTVQPGTPGGYTTVYRPHTGDPISEPITVTTIAGSNGQPGTVIIETQGPITITPTVSGGTATIFTPGTAGSTTVTKTVVLTASGGQPTTAVVIETPPVKIQPTSQAQVTGPDGLVTVTEQYSGTGVITAIFTTTVIASGTGPGTVYIETPPPIKFNPTTSAPETTVTGNDNYVTVFRPFPGPGIITAPITITQAAPSGGQPGTVVVETPVAENPTTPLPQPSTTQGTDGYVTVFLPFPGPGVITQAYTRTQAPSGGNPGTVFITTPAPLPATSTVLPAPSTTQGPDGYVTVFLPFPGPGVITQPYTRTQAPSGGNPGTVFITTPAPLPQTTPQQNLPSTTSGVDGYVTVFIPYPGPGEITAPITSTQPPSGGMPGTVFITTPVPAFSTPKQANGLTSTSSGADGYITVFVPYPGPGEITAPITSTQPPSGGVPGTVFITTPAPAFSTPKQANGLTSTSTGTDGYVTVFIPYPGPGVITAPITSTQAPANGQPGTVFVTTPASFETPKQQNGLTSTSTGTDGYVTVFLPFPGPGSITAAITSTQAPANGQPGTVYITTPAPLSTPQQIAPSTSAGTDGYVTVFLPFPGPGAITAPITSTQPPSGGNPGTVFITTPAPSTSQQGVPNTAQGDGEYVTVFLPYPGPGVITAPITSTKAPSGDNPGTVFITTPASGTVTQPQTPALTTDNYITIQTPFPGPGVITSPITITKPPANGQPGTVLIQTPAPVSSNADSYVTVYRPYPGPGTIAAPITLTQAPANGQPGTVFIETQPTNEPTSSPTSGDSASPITIPPAPTGSYVTIFRPYPGPGQISSPVTYTQAPASGQPGTVIIETPNADAPTATKTGPVTVPTGNNNPYVTVYRPYPGPGNIDQPLTITSVTASGDQPGTIVIETPTIDVNTKFAPSPTTSPPVTIPADDNNYVTVYRPHTGSPITAPVTVTTIAPSGGQPGTVIIETPGPKSQPASTDSPPVTIPQGQDGYVTVYQPYPGPGTITEPLTVSTVAPSNGQPGTVIIQTPAPAASTSSINEQTTSASAVTIPADNGGYVTVYRPYPGPGTITAPRTVGTVAATSGQPGTVIIETPAPQATGGETGSAPGVSSTQGNDGYVTVFQPYTGTGVIAGPITVSTIPPSNGQPGTVIVETPVAQTPASTIQAGDNAPVTIPPSPENSYLTVYRPHTGANLITAPVTVTTIQGENGQPGTIVIETPAAQAPTSTEDSRGAPVTIPPGPDNSYLTVYRPHTGADPITAPVTVTTIEGFNGQPGTIIIETPTPMAQTQISASDGAGAATTVPPGPDSSYVTVYRPYTGTETITTPITSTIQGINGQPGTVIIETPTPMAQTPTSAGDGTGAETTVPPGPDSSYVTVYRPYTGTETITAPTTSTIEGTNGQPGTIIIETPTPPSPDTNAPSTVPPGPNGSYVTIYRPYTGTESITAPITSTIQGTNGQPGTVIIETPTPSTPDTGAASTVPPGSGSSYVTIYRPYTGTESITAPVTSTIQGTNGQPGTVVIETPTPLAPGNNAPSTAPAGPDSSYITVYRPYTGTETIAAPLTSTIQGTNGQPGTVIIETSTPVVSDANAASTAPAGPDSTYITVYQPYPGPGKIDQPMTVTTVEPSNGNPGTIIIQTPGIETGGKVVIPPVTLDPAPGEQYTTVYRPHTGTDVITAPVTITTIAPSGGQPGTVIIETPEPETPGPNPTVTLPPGPNESYVTVFQPHTGTDVITGPVIITTIAPANGQPGTVIIETPVASEPTSAPLPADSAVSAPQATATYVTVYRPHTGSERITAPVTVTTIDPSGGQPGTVIIETPDQDLPPVTTSAGPAASYVTVYQPHTGTDRITQPVTITTIEPANGQPGTVIIETPGQQAPPVTSTPAPASYVTISRPYTGTDQINEPTTTTVPPQGDQPGTVIVETPRQANFQSSATSPPSYVTISRPYTGTDQITAPIITTVSPQGGQPGTVIYETQAPFATVFRPYTGTEQITGPVTVSTIAPSGDQPGTIIVETPGAGPAVTTTPPAPSYVTITNLYTGTEMLTEPTILTTIPPQGDQPGTVIVETQDSYATISTLYTGTGTITGPVPLTTIPPQGNQPGTIVVGTLGSYVTITTQYTGTDLISGPKALTTIPPQGDQPGTVVIATPASYVTTTVPYTGVDQITAPITATSVLPSEGQPGTVVIQTQAPFATIYRPHNGPDRITTPMTVSTIAPNGDQPGTIIVETPGSEPPVTTTRPVPTYTSVYEEYSGTDEMTGPRARTTIEPQGDQPGTIIFDTPGVRVISTSAAQASYATVYRPHSGPGRITEPVTVTTVAPQGDQPGTVIIETPGSEPAITSTPAPQPSYVTVFQPHTGPDAITEPITVTTVAPQGDQPGTVIIETPGSEPARTTGPASQPSYVTIYQPHAGPDRITEPVTLTTVAPQGDQPGTVIIETPGSEPPVTSSPAAEPSYVTVYQPHIGLDRITTPVTVTTIMPQDGQPGTVIIETPGSEPPVTSGPAPAPSYVTVYRPHTGVEQITAPVTVTTVEPQGREPGTVIIETPGSQPPVTSGPAPEPSYATIYRPYTGADQITAPITVTRIEPQGDQPGTVIIETPGSQPPFTPEPPPPPPVPQPSYVTVYQPHTGVDQITAPVTITTIEPQGGQPGTVIIETPGSQPPITSGPESASESPYVTVFRPHTGADPITAPVTITTIQRQGDRPGTVIIETPGSGEPVTSTPGSYSTIYEPYTGTGEFTGEVTRTVALPQGDRPGTVVVQTSGSRRTSDGPYTTIYEPHTGTGEFTGEVTRTIAAPQGDSPGTVVIETPGSGRTSDGPYTTIYEPHTGTGEFTGEVTRTVAVPQGDSPGTVVVETPGSGRTSDGPYTTIYEPHTGTGEFTGEVTRTIAPPQGDRPGTVIIETAGSGERPTSAPEGSYTTIYEPHTGPGEFTGEVTRTVASPQGDRPGTIIIETAGSGERPTSAPEGSYTTIYEPHTGTGEFTGEVTRTVASPRDGQPGTVVVETPGPQTANKGTNPPLTIPAGDDSYVTVFRPHTGMPQITAPVTVTTIAPSNGQPGTVIIETPVPETAASSDFGNPPVTIPAGDDQYVTVFRPHTGSDAITAPVTVTTIAPSGGQPGTVIIETPEPATNIAPTGAAPEDVFVTIYRPYTGAEQITAPVTVTTIAPVSGTGTVIIETLVPQTASDVYVTIYRPYTGTERITEPTTVTTIAPVSGTGTVIVETPTPEPTVDTQPSASPAITIPSNDESRNVTVIRPYPGPGAVTAPVTRYVPPTAAGEPGTVVIETPVEESTTEAQPQSQPTSAPAVTIPPSDGSPNITVVRQYPGPGVITAPVTSYEPPKTPGKPGTVIIETPAPVSSTISGPVDATSGQADTMSGPAGTNVTFYTLAPPGVKTPITSYAPPQTPGQTGTVFIQTIASEPGMSSDSGRNVTIMTDGPASLTTPYTRYQPPGTPGDPGTVLIETPGVAGQGERNVTVMTQGPASLTAPYTRYQPPGTPGDPGTVLIETPGAAGQGDKNVTVMTQGTGSITAPLTRYQPPGSPGDPGTVIIETPPVRSLETTSEAAVTIPAHAGSPNVTVIRGGPGKEATTIYVPPTGTEPGTIIIETPTDAATTQEEKTTSGDQITSQQPAVTLPPTANSPNVTVIQPYPGPGSITEPLTRYVPPTAAGEPGTVIIETQTADTPVPTSANPEITLPPSSQSPNVTVIRPYPGPGSITEPVTRYVPPTASGEPGTVIIETQTTETSAEPPKTSPEGQGTSDLPGITIPANSGSPNVTVFRPYTGPGAIETPITSYIAPAKPGEPGTVVIETPASPRSESFVQSEAGSTSGPASVSAVLTTGDTTTALSPGSSNPDALTLTPSDVHDDVTIIEPNTKFAGATENVTQIIPPSGGAPGTKIIYTPVNTPGAASSGVPDTDTYVTISATVTIPGDPSTRTGSKSNAGSEAGTTGAETNVIIIPPSGTEPGTVLSQTSVYLDQTLAQHGNVTITRAAPAGVTTPLTTYSPPAQSSDNGTIIVEIPDYNVTTTRAGPSGITKTLTTYSPPAAPGEPGMVIIETPDYNVTITRQAPASVTSLRTTYNPPGTPGDPGTVVVETPNNDYNVTITRGASITAPFTTYSPPGTSGDPGTVIIETPDYNVTVTTQAPASVTSVRTKYVPPASLGDPGTVFLETPNNAYNVTVTRAAPASVTSMYTTYAPPGSPGDPGTVFVETPDYNVTVTRGASVTAPFTTYSPPATPGDPGTIIVETPDYNVTVTTEAPRTVTTLRSTYIPPGKLGDPGTVIVETPIGPYNVTTTRGASITAPFTTYSPPGSPGDPGTVIVETPDYNVTITRQGPKTATAVLSTYSPPGSPGDPGTVIIETPADAYNVTTTRGASTITTPFTTFLPPGEPGDPGTVLVETPDYNVTITRQAPKSVTSLVSIYSPPGSAGDPGTVIIETPMGPYNITTTRGASSVTAPLTTYLAPGQPGDPGTVLVETPEYNVTVTSEATDSVSDTVTRYNPPASPGDPGTIAIIMPNQKAASTSPNPSITDGPGQNVTVYRPGPRTLTGPVTSYIPPASRGGNGTVLIETPGPATDFNITTTQTISTITAIYTTYLPAGAADDPGTILVGVPPLRNVTVTQEDTTITAPYTTYSPPGAAGDPGTVIIGMPADRNVSITSIVSTRTAPYTSYLPPANRGDPGTVVIELPPDSNVTTTKTVTDRTAPYTTYSAPANRGDPGTVIIEVPPGRNVTVTEVASTITSPYTSYSSPAKQGDPGTVFIGLPPDSNVTITTEVASRTAPYTRYSPPANQGDPGTVIVELPPDSNTTITTEVASRTKPYTTYLSPANKGDPGTVVVEMPPDSNTTITTEVASRTRPYTTYMSPANKGDPGTVIVEMPPDTNVTITTEVATRTRPYTTFASPANKGDPGTVIVEMPPDSNVTVTTEVAGLTAPYTSYASPGSQGDPGTVVIGMPPDRNVTITTEVPTRTAPYTTYSAPGSRGDPGTIVVELPPDRNVTITTEVSGRTAPYTSYATPGSKGDPGTVIIELPPQRNVTTTEQVPTLTQAYTTYSPPGSRGDPGTVIVRLPPDRNVTRTTTIDTLTAPSTVYSAPANRGDPGTIIIELPPDRNVTTTEVVNTITRATTTYAPPANQGDPGTVIVQEPPETNTTIVEVIPTITRPVTRFVTPGTKGDPGTVYIDVPPNHNVTITTTVSTITRPSTTFAPGATQGDAGTVLVEMPPEYNITTTQTIQTISRPATRYSAPAEIGDPGTVYLDMPPEYNVTVTTTIYSITRQMTTFAPGATQGDPGTVIIEMPPEYNVTTTQTVQTISRPVTRYSKPGEIGDPGTIYVDLPPEYNVTVTTTVPTITRQSTTFAPAAQQGDPGTIIIELPPDTNVTTTQTVQTISRPLTRYSKPGQIGDPGTVYVDLPPEYNVTRTTTVATIMRPSTTFVSASEQGDAGTILIQMPPDTNITTTQTVSTISRPTTRYSTPGTVGDPGTVYVDLPPEYNVTSTTTVATITRASTTFAPANVQGDPGTIIVQLPPGSNVTVSSVVPTITRPATRFATPANAGDPGTVFIDLPPEYNVTSTTTIATITRASTTFASAGVQGDPGTVIVQLPPDSNVTVSSVIPTITRPATRFATPANAGDPGTVFVDLPPEYNVTTTQTVSTISRAMTTYNPAGNQGDPGTILVQVPPEYNVTTTETVSSVSRIRTTYNPAGTQGDPNTILVQVPPDYNVTTTQTASDISRVRTTYIPAATQGDPNTVLVQVPPDYNVTTTETVSTISRVRTMYNPAGTQGDPNTVLVQVPVDYNITTTETVSTISRVRTSYYPAGTQGDPNTVLVQVPVDYNITTTETVSTISRVRTTYNPAGTQGDPNTVLVQVPVDYNVTTTETISTISRVRTSYYPAGTQGDPNTVLVQVPVDYNVTTTETVLTISRARTTYNPGAIQGDPGTVLVQIPPNVTATQTVDTITQAVTTFVSAGTDGAPGTVLIELPGVKLAPSIGASAPSAPLSDPSASVPGVPSASLPSASLPSVSLPSVSLPAASLPSAPGVSAPSASLPSAGLPSASLPSASLPAASLPSAPAVSVPSASVSVAPALSSSVVQVPAVVSTSTSSKLPQASFGPTFDCDGFGYVISTLLGNTLTKVNLIDGTRTTVATGIGPGGTLLNTAGVSGAINGIGYNKLDGYIYGMVNQGLVSGVLCGLLGCPSSQLIRIAKNGAYETLKLTIPSNMIDMGDVDEQGRFWVAENGKKWWCIDVNPASSTFGKLLNSGTSATDIISGVGDWAYVPGGGDYLYAVQASIIESGLLRTNIVRWSRTTFTWSRYQSYPNLILTSTNLVWGAVMAGPDGTLYAQENLLGQTWKFTLGSTANPTAIPGGAIANLQGDGARCIDAKTVFPPFTCDGKAYVISNLLGNTLTSVNLNDGSRSTVANNIGPGGAIDAIGYSKLDNYIYGVVDQGLVTGVVTTVLGGAQSAVIRIASDGQYQTLSVTIPSNTITMGDVDDQGRLWLSESGKRWWCIDLNPTSATAYKMIANGTSTADLISGVGDWAYVPGGGDYLYAVQASIIESGLMRTNIVRWSRTAHTWERYQTYPNLILTSLNLVWGAVWAGPGGTLYAQENVLGQTWKFTLGSSSNPVAIPGGTIANLQGDGARCIGQDPATTIPTVQQQPSSTLTITITVPTLTQVITSLALPGISGGAATVQVQVPPKTTVTATQTVSSITRLTTVLVTATALGVPDTVLVQLPLPYNVTITTAGPTTLASLFTTYSPPAQLGDPGTVIVQRPPVTITTAGPTTLASLFTTYVPPAQSGDPGTFIVQRPPVTVTTNGGTTISVPFTTYNPPGASGDPGTVVVATPAPQASTTSPSGPAFSCDVYGYLVQKTSLYRVDITTGKTTLISSTVGGGGWINGVGYNRFDNYLYGMYQDSTGTQLIRIGGDGSSTLLAARTSDRNINMGDIDNQGRFWVSNNGGAWWTIDLMPGSSTYGKIIMSGTATTAFKAADWAFVPGGGDFMYSIMYDTTGLTSTLCRFSRTSYTWQTVKAYGNIAGSNVWGACYANGDGSLYGSENSSGQIWQFPIAPTVGNPKFIATGPVSSWNDGARCIDSQIVKQ